LNFDKIQEDEEDLYGSYGGVLWTSTWLVGHHVNDQWEKYQGSKERMNP
jgi:hypothetical protein